jgi:hypothetical protein
VPQSTEVVVLVTDGLVEVTQTPLILKQSGGQEVLWRCYQGEMKIQFQGDTPFAADTFLAAKGGGSASGTPARQAVRKDAYRYAAEVRVGDRIHRGEGFEIYVDP